MANDTTTPPSPSKPIGQMNGPWALLLKFSLVTYPILASAIISWGIWVTANVYEIQNFRHFGDRFTQVEGDALRADMLEGDKEVLKVAYTTKDLLQNFEREVSRDYMRYSEHRDTHAN